MAQLISTSPDLMPSKRLLVFEMNVASNSRLFKQSSKFQRICRFRVYLVGADVLPFLTLINSNSQYTTMRYPCEFSMILSLIPIYLQFPVSPLLLA
jgi:hypothetical protein